MSIYRFVLRSRAGQVEELGFMPLLDDREAVAFGETVVRDLVEGSPYTARGLGHGSDQRRALRWQHPDRQF